MGDTWLVWILHCRRRRPATLLLLVAGRWNKDRLRHNFVCSIPTSAFFRLETVGAGTGSNVCKVGEFAP